VVPNFPSRLLHDLGLAAWFGGTLANAGRVLGRKVSQETSVPVSSGTEPSAATPPGVAGAQTQLKLLQWAVPAITGALVGVSAYACEQQRPVAVEAGMSKKLTRRGSVASQTTATTSP
jgi:hypothetical protein